MSQTVSVPVNPAVMRWARESLGVSIDEAAARLKQSPAVIVAWENGAELPTLGPLRDLAEFYRRPLAAFLLPSVPKDPPAPADFRVMAGGNHHELSRTTRAVLNRAFELRSVAADLERREPGPETSGARVLDDQRTPPEEAAARVRQDLAVSIDDQRAWRSTNQALNAWRRALERRGVLVFFMTMPLSEIRGFSLSGPGGPPAIVLNSGDVEAARMFSLFHEYGHVLMGTGGICMPSAGPTRLSLAGREHYCNQFAGAVLVPRDALAAMPEARALGEAATTPSDRDIAPVAAMFRVSKQVLWYRLRDTDLITTQRFAAKWAAWAHQSPPPKRKGGSGQPPGKRVLNQKGLRFTGLVLDARGERLITTNEALDYLAIRLNDLDDVEAEARRRAVG